MTPRTDASSARHLTPGDAAPDLNLVDGEGRPVLLSSLWRTGPIVLTFLRHFG